MGHLLSLGSVNADFVVRADEVPSGPGSIVADQFLRTSGGKAANVSVIAARLGAGAVLLGCVGDDDLAEQALTGPRRDGVDVAGVRRRSGPTGYSSVVVPADGEKSIVLAPNANDAWADDASAVRADIATAPRGSVLVVDAEIPPGLVGVALDEARARGFVTVLDPAPPERVPAGWLRLADHLTPDAAEAALLTGIETDTEDGAARAAQQLRSRGAGCVHVKLRNGGCVTASEVLTVHDVPADLAVVDATGAGDAFAGALGWALLGGRSPLDAAALAVAASACAVGRYGSQESYPSLRELLAMADRVSTRQLA